MASAWVLNSRDAWVAIRTFLCWLNTWVYLNYDYNILQSDVCVLSRMATAYTIRTMTLFGPSFAEFALVGYPRVIPRVIVTEVKHLLQRLHPISKCLPSHLPLSNLRRQNKRDGNSLILAYYLSTGGGRLRVTLRLGPFTLNRDLRQNGRQSW